MTILTQAEFITGGPDQDPEYNSAGFRCKEFDDIDMDNYILFAGSSHTEGVGVKPEQTFAHLVSTVLKCDQVNLGVGGGGIDAVEHNLLMWFLKHKKLPKAIVVEWPDYARFMRDNYGHANLCPAGMWSDSEFITYAEQVLYLKGEISYHNLHRLMPVKIIDIMHSKVTLNVNSMMIWHTGLDIGTDDAHPGPKSHSQTAENILQALDR